MTVLATSTERWVIHASFTRRVAGHAVPVAAAAISDGAGGAYTVAVSIVHVETIGTIEANEVLSALKTTSWAACAD